MVAQIIHDGRVLAVLNCAGSRQPGIHFITPDDFTQQLAYMFREKGYVIAPHVHTPALREIVYTKEVLFIRSGRVRVDFYDDSRRYLKSCILESGDVILLAFGGHGLEMLEDSEIVEVKQGPYLGEMDKSRFEPVPKGELHIVEWAGSR